MAVNLLYPSFIKLDYHTAFAPHVAIIPTRQIQGIGGPVTDLFYESWGGISVAANDMVDDLVDLLRPFQPDTCIWDLATFFNVQTPESGSDPVGIKSLGQVGTNIADGVPAAQSNFTFRTSEFGLLKIVLLDTQPSADFKPVGITTAGAELLALNTFLTDHGAAYAGRDGGEPTTFSKATYTLNEKLRKEYHYT